MIMYRGTEKEKNLHTCGNQNENGGKFANLWEKFSEKMF